MASDFMLRLPSSRGGRRLWWNAASVLPSLRGNSIGGASGCTSGLGAGGVQVRPSSALQAVKTMIHEAGVQVGPRLEVELSHHRGIERFGDTGVAIVSRFNREYCKKLLAMLPGQDHPEQYHHQKEETFVVLHGTMRLWLDGVERECGPGDVVTVARGVRHRFQAITGVVFEEISSTHQVQDSFYTDPAIGANPHRKTFLAYWM